MTQTRRIPVRSGKTLGEEPLLEQARRRVAEQGGNLRLILRELRDERKKRAEKIALDEAPQAVMENGKYVRVSSDPRWPFGVEGKEIVAPFGLNGSLLPRTIDPNSARAIRNNAASARREARELISKKLERLGCDPIAIIAEIAMSKAVKDEVRLRAAAELTTMVYPRLKSVEVNQREEKTVFVIGIPAERPATADEWLAQAEGPRRIEQQQIIDVEATVVEPGDERK